MTVRHRDLALDWLGYATLRIGGPDRTVYFDPGRYGVLTGEFVDHPDHPHPPSADRRPEDGDVVCVTHRHHYDPDGIERVAAPDATVVVFDGMDLSASDRDLPRPTTLPYDVLTVDAETETVVDDAPLWTVPAYNRPDGPNTRPDGSPIHPEGRGCGYVVSVDGVRVFWPGDSDVLPGHEALDPDVFVPSIAREYTMDRHGAASLAEAMDPDLVVPIHYNTFATLRADSAAFAADVAGRAIPIALDER